VCGVILPHTRRQRIRHAVFLAAGFMLGRLIDVGADW
jgi:hypothetical protein